MTEAGRIAAAIAVLEAILAQRQAADRALREWFGRSRFAGSGDRRAISELVYRSLRRYARLSWRLGESSPRLLILGASGHACEQLVAICTGVGHAPAPLTVPEQEALRRPAPPAPDWVAAECPEWLWPHFTARFGAAAGAELAALQERAAFDLRVNTLKTDRAAMQAVLGGAPTPLAPAGLRFAEPVRLDTHPAYRDGLVEPQDEAAQLAALLVDAQPGMTVVDFCAGAGGKTLALAAAMANRGRLVAHDADRARLRRLGPRAARAGASIVQVAERPPVAAAERVLLDVPCSGTGTWRRNPEARWLLQAEDLARHQARQAELLDQGAARVKPGGRLVYATCSLLPVEDEGAVDAFLQRTPAFARLDAAAEYARLTSRTAPFAGPDMLLTPFRHGCDGFYVAILERRS